MRTNVGITTTMLNASEQRDREERQRLKSTAPADAIKASRVRKLEAAGRYCFLHFPGSKAAEDFVDTLTNDWRIVGMSGATEPVLLLERQKS
jgi:hypothetical protein